MLVSANEFSICYNAAKYDMILHTIMKNIEHESDFSSLAPGDAAVILN